MHDHSKPLHQVSYLSQLGEMLTKDLEVDSNVFEDRNRETQLDASLDSYLEELEQESKKNN